MAPDEPYSTTQCQVAPVQPIVDDWNDCGIKVIAFLVEGEDGKTVLPVGRAFDVLSVEIAAAAALDPYIEPSSKSMEVDPEAVSMSGRTGHSFLLKLPASGVAGELPHHVAMLEKNLLICPSFLELDAVLLKL